MQEGYKLNEIYEMDLHYYMSLAVADEKPKEEKSLISAFGG